MWRTGSLRSAPEGQTRTFPWISLPRRRQFEAVLWRRARPNRSRSAGVGRGLFWDKSATHFTEGVPVRIPRTFQPTCSIPSSKSLHPTKGPAELSPPRLNGALIVGLMANWKTISVTLPPLEVHGESFYGPLNLEIARRR